MIELMFVSDLLLGVASRRCIEPVVCFHNRLPQSSLPCHIYYDGVLFAHRGITDCGEIPHSG